MTQADCQTVNGTYYDMTNKGLDTLIQEYFDHIQALIMLVNDQILRTATTFWLLLPVRTYTSNDACSYPAAFEHGKLQCTRLRLHLEHRAA